MSSETSPARQTADQAARDHLARQAHALRRAGATVASIADQIGLHPSKVRRLLAREGKRLQLERRQLAAVAVEVELDRLDAALRRAWQIMMGDSGPESVLKAVDRVLKVSAARARLLGLEAPQKVAWTDPTGERPVLAPVTDEARADAILRLLQKTSQHDEKASE